MYDTKNAIDQTSSHTKDETPWQCFKTHVMLPFSFLGSLPTARNGEGVPVTATRTLAGGFVAGSHLRRMG